jgi:hypothetical protein
VVRMAVRPAVVYHQHQVSGLVSLSSASFCQADQCGFEQEMGTTVNVNNITTNIILSVIGVLFTALLIRIYTQVRALARRVPFSRTHFRFYRGRSKFNELGIEILNGGVAGDTIYLILRSGTFIGDFAKAIAQFRAHQNTKCIVIVPDVVAFCSNYGEALKAWITELYENPACDGARALLLEPGTRNPEKQREAGYLFISDGHNHDDDEGFYTASAQAVSFLRSYLLNTVKAGTRSSFGGSRAAR